MTVLVAGLVVRPLSAAGFIMMAYAALLAALLRPAPQPHLSDPSQSNPC